MELFESIAVTILATWISIGMIVWTVIRHKVFANPTLAHARGYFTQSDYICWYISFWPSLIVRYLAMKRDLRERT